MNANELRAVVNRIEAVVTEDPRRFDMHDWLIEEACGTVGCFAGWAMTEEQQKAYLNCYGASPWTIACKRFDIHPSHDHKPGEDDRLFLVDHWPYEFEMQYRNAQTGLERVAALRARVEHFIATGGTE
jgi:hypothetical protein